MIRFIAMGVCLGVLCTGAAWSAVGFGDSATGAIDTVLPTFTVLHAEPNAAQPGDLVTLTIEASEALLSDPSVQVNGHAASFVSFGAKAVEYVFEYEVQPLDPSGPATIQISGIDVVGNTGTFAGQAGFTVQNNAFPMPLPVWGLALALCLVGALALRKRTRLPLLLFVLLAPAALAQPVVTNVTFQQRPGQNHDTEIVVHYDLSSPAGACTVSLQLSNNNGASFDVTPESVSGDVGEDVAPGTAKEIVWDVAADLPGAAIANAVFRVTADDNACSGCLLWSDPATWGGSKPVAGEDVTIPNGTHILLDEDTPALDGLMINGTLEFAREDLALTADWIMVHGTLQVGTATSPFTHSAVITLAADDPDQDIMDMGTRGIMVMGGTLDLHGAPPATKWTKLSAHAAAGAGQLQVLAANGWSAGDEVVVAPTDWYGTSVSEAFSLNNVNGIQLSLNGTLATPRWGLLQYVTSTGMSLTQNNSITPPLPNTPGVLDERAEVANLTRNIVIQAPDDALWQSQGFGVHVMIMETDGVARVDGVEFRRGGQRGELGRYPFHWHMLSYSGVSFLGDTSGQYIRNSTINRSANRGIVIHGTNGVTVEDNIVYDVRGHGLFTEDAVERRNTITGNLVLHVRDPEPDDALKRHEFNHGGPAGGSSGYWIANPDNTVVGNTAADCQGFGFWLAFPDNPWGASIGVPMRPSRIEFGTFENNTAHTSGFEGMMFDNVEINNLGNVGPLQYISTIDEQDPTWNSGTARRFSITRFATWKNRRGGIWDRVYWPDFREIVAADNCGRFFAGSGADGIIEACLVVGTSLNNATPRPSTNFPDTLGGDETPTAFATYHSAFDMRNNVIVEFPLTADERSGAFATEDYYIRPVDKGQMRNPGNQLINSHPGYRSQAVFDYFVLAGALWDPHGIWGPQGNWSVYDSPFFTYGLTAAPIEPAGQTGAVSVPGPFYGIMEFVINNDRPYFEPTMALDVARLDPTTLAEVGTWTVEESQPGWLLFNMRHFAAHQSGIYRLEFPGASMPTDLELRFENMLEETDTLVLGVQFDGDTTPGAVYHIGGGSGASVRVYNPVNSLQEVRDSAGLTYWRDTTNDLIWVKLQGGSWQWWDQTGQIAVPSADELLYETTILHINTD